VGLRELRPLEGIAHVRSTGGDLNLEVVQIDSPNAARRGTQRAMAEADEEGVSGVNGMDMRGLDVFESSAIY